MAVSAVRGQLTLTESDRPEAIFPMFVADESERLWHPLQWDSTVVYLNNEQKAVILLTSPALGAGCQSGRVVTWNTQRD